MIETINIPLNRIENVIFVKSDGSETTLDQLSLNGNIVWNKNKGCVLQQSNEITKLQDEYATDLTLLGSSCLGNYYLSVFNDYTIITNNFTTWYKKSNGLTSSTDNVVDFAIDPGSTSTVYGYVTKKGNLNFIFSSGLLNANAFSLKSLNKTCNILCYSTFDSKAYTFSSGVTCYATHFNSSSWTKTTNNLSNINENTKFISTSDKSLLFMEDGNIYSGATLGKKFTLYKTISNFSTDSNLPTRTIAKKVNNIYVYCNCSDNEKNIHYSTDCDTWNTKVLDIPLNIMDIYYSTKYKIYTLLGYDAVENKNRCYQFSSFDDSFKEIDISNSTVINPSDCNNISTTDGGKTVVTMNDKTIYTFDIIER